MAHHFTSYIKARIYCERTVQPGREFFGSIAYQYNDMSKLWPLYNPDFAHQTVTTYSGTPVNCHP